MFLFACYEDKTRTWSGTPCWKEWETVGVPDRGAITIHKSQGMSLDAAVIDLAQAFEYGQGYVAISRVRTLAGLYLLGLNARALEVHPDILAKDAEFRTQSAEAMEKLRGMNVKEARRAQEKFIMDCGGKIEVSTTPPVRTPSKSAAIKREVLSGRSG